MANKLYKQIDYEKLSDDLMILGPNVVLRFNVVLAKALPDGTRSFFHKDYEYNASKYTNVKSLVTMRRSFDYYISIENFRNNESGFKEFIMIRVSDILYVREQLKLAARWFRDIEFQELFAKKGNDIIIYKRVEPIGIYGLTSDKYIIMEPVVIKYPNDTCVTGIRMYISSKNQYIDISADKFMGLIYIIDSINMYESAQLLINYLGSPELGEYVTVYDPRDRIPTDESKEDIDIKSKGRQIGDNGKKQNFFDKMDKL
ncbi:MAG: hypothetical protein ACRCXT_13295 [Paraclostridium sp.]